MNLNELKSLSGARKAAFRKGRGPASGNGKTAGRGHKGQNARSGGGVRLGFEGGQTPLFRRLPKRGFTNVFRTEYAEVNVGQLNAFENGSVITVESLIESGLVKSAKATNGVKLLANGKLEKKLTVQLKHVSAGAKAAVEAAGGTIEVK